METEGKLKEAVAGLLSETDAAHVSLPPGYWKIPYQLNKAAFEAVVDDEHKTKKSDEPIDAKAHSSLVLLYAFQL